MNFFDLFIIYSACGAPFGVYYFLYRRNCSFSKQHWLKTILVFFFWVPFAVRLLFFRSDAGQSANNSENLSSGGDGGDLSKKVERLLTAGQAAASVFEVREIIERYAGLTQSSNVAGEDENFPAVAEFARAGGKEPSKIVESCFARRNQSRLNFHQNRARTDFLQLVSRFSETDDRIAEAKTVLIEFADSIGDADGQKSIEVMLNRAAQNQNSANVRDTEIKLWKPAIHKHLSVRQTSMNMRTAKAANSSGKD